MTKPSGFHAVQVEPRQQAKLSGVELVSTVH
jgi:hypothetical protein